MLTPHLKRHNYSTYGNLMQQHAHNRSGSETEVLWHCRLCSMTTTTTLSNLHKWAFPSVSCMWHMQV